MQDKKAFEFTLKAALWGFLALGFLLLVIYGFTGSLLRSVLIVVSIFLYTITQRKSEAFRNSARLTQIGKSMADLMWEDKQKEGP